MPMISSAPIVSTGVRPSVSATVAAPITAAPAQNTARRPTRASNRPELSPATTLPAANAATCSPPIE